MSIYTTVHILLGVPRIHLPSLWWEYPGVGSHCTSLQLHNQQCHVGSPGYGTYNIKIEKYVE